MDKTLQDIYKMILHPGDLLTVTSCGGGLQEYYFKGYDGTWIVGYPTRLTQEFDGFNCERNDIYYRNITHINRLSVDSIEAPEFIRFVERARLCIK